MIAFKVSRTLLKLPLFAQPNIYLIVYDLAYFNAEKYILNAKLTFSNLCDNQFLMQTPQCAETLILYVLVLPSTKTKPENYSNLPNNRVEPFNHIGVSFLRN